ncbi:MAG: AmmeMemoRadiSam system radical SAM enzyme [Lentisphaerae bacterium GWF2_49_21]|nr:MAG: AmmeMemoRadiSam system radical SAM enzyme [Lentisphaerae bacterium GWF2_49_21]
MQNLHEARWWQPEQGNKVFCRLCPRACHVFEDRTGFCGVRKNIAGKLYALAYGHPVALNIDPIEKKPLAEFMPGTWTFSLGTYGCNLACSFCQNYHLSRGYYDKEKGEGGSGKFFSPEKIVQLAMIEDCKSIAFTYNEPVIWSEYVIDIATLAKKAGLATVLVSNGYVTPEAAADLFPLIDAANMDMKGFSEDFYSKMTGGRLAPVLDAIKYYLSLGGHLEITNLVIPNKNDSDEMIGAFLDWTEENLGKEIPLHFSAYHPDYKYKESPRTPPGKLYEIRENAMKRGFKSVYLGNIFLVEPPDNQKAKSWTK